MPKKKNKVMVVKTGRSIEQVQAEDYAVERLPDLNEETQKIKNLYDNIEKVETTAKLEIYKRLARIYIHRERVLDEHLAKHFSKYIESLGVNKSTAYKDAKVVQFVTEYGIVDLLNTRTVKNLVRKLKEIAYKPPEIKEEIIPKLEYITLREIQDAGDKKNQIKWHQSGRLPKVRYRSSHEQITIEVKEPELRIQIFNIISKLDRNAIKKIEKLLK